VGARLGLNPTQLTVAAISVISRLCDPGSEHALQAWMDQTALPEIVGHTALGKGDDRFYRVSDALLRNASAIKAHLRQRQAILCILWNVRAKSAGDRPSGWRNRSRVYRT
jgi:hypothetical protein